MLAPTDKSNDMIQIQVTTACPIRTCSNCVYAIPFRKTAHMSLECYTLAVRSLRDWPGYACMMGGNPPSHPQFAELCAILAREIAPEHRGIVMSDPMEHGELIRSTFLAGRMLLNAHGDTTLAARLHALFPGKRVNGLDGKNAIHSPLLVDYADLGVDPGSWITMRESCDMNANWSAGIFEHEGQPVAYFCEVCGVIDDLLGLNHGIPAVAGWWRQPMLAFEDQVRNCCDAGCGIPLRQVGHADREAIHDASETWAARVGSAAGVTINPVCAMGEKARDVTDYQRLRGGRR